MTSLHNLAALVGGKAVTAAKSKTVMEAIADVRAAFGKGVNGISDTKTKTGIVVVRGTFLDGVLEVSVLPKSVRDDAISQFVVNAYISKAKFKSGESKYRDSLDAKHASALKDLIETAKDVISESEGTASAEPVTAASGSKDDREHLAKLLTNRCPPGAGNYWNLESANGGYKLELLDEKRHIGPSLSPRLPWKSFYEWVMAFIRGYDFKEDGK